MAAEMPSVTIAPASRRRGVTALSRVWRHWWVRAFVALVWIFFVLYPNPMMLVHSINRVSNVPVDAPSVASLAAMLPDDPSLIENAVLVKLVPYALDWQVSGVPWYFPTTQEVLRDKQGDCESRATLLASILTAKHIPYRMKISMDHIWIDYPGKVANAIENDQVAIGVGEGHGFQLSLPRARDVWESVRSGFDWYWEAMPWPRKTLIIGGISIILFGAMVVSLMRRLVAPARRPHVAQQQESS